MTGGKTLAGRVKCISGTQTQVTSIVSMAERTCVDSMLRGYRARDTF